MRDFALEIRMELFRTRPELSLSHVERLVQDIPRCYRDITRDHAACGVTEWKDFYNFTLADGVALATIFRKAEVEVLVFDADDSLIHTTEHLAMGDVDEFLQAVRSRFRLPDTGLTFPMPQALPWLESVETV